MTSITGVAVCPGLRSLFPTRLLQNPVRMRPHRRPAGQAGVSAKLAPVYRNQTSRTPASMVDASSMDRLTPPIRMDSVSPCAA